MPVLPELGSRMMSPATSCPSASAVSTIDLAIRSLTDPPGFIPSNLRKIFTAGLGES